MCHKYSATVLASLGQPVDARGSLRLAIHDFLGAGRVLEGDLDASKEALAWLLGDLGEVTQSYTDYLIGDGDIKEAVELARWAVAFAAIASRTIPGGGWMKIVRQSIEPLVEHVEAVSAQAPTRTRRGGP